MKRIITILPILVCLAGAGLIAAYFVQEHRADEQQEQEKKAAVADKVNRLPVSDEPANRDREIAERAFASPQSIDASPTTPSMPPSMGQHVRVASNEVLAVSSSAGQIQAAQVANVPEVIDPADQVGANGGRVQERVDPASKEYQKRVDSLMDMRQRRLAGKGEDHE